MASDLRRRTADGSAVHAAEFILSSARLGELHECSALLRHTRMRAAEIVDEARTLLAEAERHGHADRVRALRQQLEQARRSYSKVLDAYVTICGKITDERQAIMRAQVEPDRRPGLSGVA
ncbi:hypothetical protein FE391_16565 [Nonomuraea sp. KC401]|uniref:hypothetical protein n=1 Tax=unclassified Nonomuraea TaxID=2593643 RepID=UPI0010FE8B35|nr:MULTISPECIES: hypothetical protein [unclassified Nonomuraea]NBE94585.1 hypothetical protein [Nonomuraea sp. K271]TLF72669.1 hypothetical protein FE391_16565 [Nonomuraea sp. KC401]